MSSGLDEQRLWLDGCWDFFHHGHAGAIRQAKLMGSTLVVGCHSDEDIARNKGPTVMRQPERIAAIEACRWVDMAVPDAPYVTQESWMDRYGCMYVVHGDDVTTDAEGNDTYARLKRLNRYKECKRTVGISTTDLVGRMLVGTREHHITPLSNFITRPSSIAQFADYAKGPDAITPLVTLLRVDPITSTLSTLVPGAERHPDACVMYVSGSWDLFTPTHMDFLRQVHAAHPQAYVVVGIEDDKTANANAGLNYPIMNLYERTLCVLQCRYVSAVVMGANHSVHVMCDLLPEPLRPHRIYRPGRETPIYESNDRAFPSKNHGLEAGTTKDAYVNTEPAIVHTIDTLAYDVSAGSIVQRIMSRRTEYEQRQARKGAKTSLEQRLKQAKSTRGRLIVVEGLDRSGKTTQVSRLVDHITQRHSLPAVAHKFPDRTTVIGKMIDAYLQMKADMDDHAVHLLFAANRWECMPAILAQLDAGTSVVLDRYVYSGICFSAAKRLSDGTAPMTWEWCRSPDVGLPMPDLVLFLNVAPQVQEQRGGFGGERYEQTALQERVRGNFARAQLDHEALGGIWCQINADLGLDQVTEQMARAVDLLLSEPPAQQLSLFQ